MKPHARCHAPALGALTCVLTLAPGIVPAQAHHVGPDHVKYLISLVGKPDAIAPYIAPDDFAFREVQPPGTPQDRAEFLAGMKQMTEDYTEMSLDVDSVLVHRPDSLEARGRFSALYRKRTRFNLHFAITMRFDAHGRVDRWWDHFRLEAF